MIKSCGCISESNMATNIKKYFYEKYGAKLEYPAFKNPKTGKWLEYDIYIERLNIYIELHGNQHYTKNLSWKDDAKLKKDRIQRDKLKRMFAMKNGFFIETKLSAYLDYSDAILYIEEEIKNTYKG